MKIIGTNHCTPLEVVGGDLVLLSISWNVKDAFVCQSPLHCVHHPPLSLLGVTGEIRLDVPASQCYVQVTLILLNNG